ncbi:hypothetical protein [Modestobacter versicolor]|uniref:hypothetical protein n=1 Tax=Modestobacter versicolor TaxID=429133 RepID=UPI0034DEE662
MTEQTVATTIDTAAVDAALQQFREVLASDGYLLRWTAAAADQVVVHVEAGPDACAECLVPLPVMQAIMNDALESTPYSVDHVVLPNGK